MSSSIVSLDLISIEPDVLAIELRKGKHLFLPKIPFECESFSIYHKVMDFFPEYFSPGDKVDINLLNSNHYDKLSEYFYQAIKNRNAKHIKWGINNNISKTNDICINLISKLEDLKFAYYSGLPLGKNIFNAVVTDHSESAGDSSGDEWEKIPEDILPTHMNKNATTDKIEVLDWLYSLFEINAIEWGENYQLNLIKDNRILKWLHEKNCPWFIHHSSDNHNSGSGVKKTGSVIYDSNYIISDNNIPVDNNNIPVENNIVEDVFIKPNNVPIENDISVIIANENVPVENNIPVIVADENVANENENNIPVIVANENENIENNIPVIVANENENIENNIPVIVANENHANENIHIENENNINIANVANENDANENIANENNIHIPFVAEELNILSFSIKEKKIKCVNKIDIINLAKSCKYDEIKSLHKSKKIPIFDPEVTNIVTKNGDYDMTKWLLNNGWPLGNQVEYLLKKRGF
jgi:hypothetical protein